jgi:hypothetical protein
MNTPHGVRCIAKSLDHRDLWTARSPKKSDWHQCSDSEANQSNPNGP